MENKRYLKQEHAKIVIEKDLKVIPQEFKDAALTEEEYYIDFGKRIAARHKELFGDSKNNEKKKEK